MMDVELELDEAAIHNFEGRSLRTVAVMGTVSAEGDAIMNVGVTLIKVIGTNTGEVLDAAMTDEDGGYMFDSSCSPGVYRIELGETDDEYDFATKSRQGSVATDDTATWNFDADIIRDGQRERRGHGGRRRDGRRDGDAHRRPRHRRGDGDVVRWQLQVRRVAQGRLHRHDREPGRGHLQLPDHLALGEPGRRPGSDRRVVRGFDEPPGQHQRPGARRGRRARGRDGEAARRGTGGRRDGRQR